MRLPRLLRALCAPLVVVSLLAAMLIAAEPALAQKVANPGPITFTSLGGSGSFGSQVFNLTPQCSNGEDDEATPDTAIDYPADPECTGVTDNSETDAGFQAPLSLSGTIAADGTVLIPQANVTFPPQAIPVEGVGTIGVTVTANSNATGTLNPLTGAASIAASLRIRLSGVPLAGADCGITPINVTLTTGTSGSLTGIPYNSDTGQITLVANNFSVPGSSSCGLAGGTINSTLGLPLAAGGSAFTIVAEVTPGPLRGVDANVTTAPDPAEVQAETDVLTVDAASSTAVAGVASYRFDPGNGAPAITQASPVFNYTYPAAGNFTANVRVTDNDGDTSQQNIPVAVTPRPANVPPVAVASADVTSGEVPLAVQFTGDQSSDTDGVIVSHLWSFGDGGTSTSPNPAHAYLAAGSYTASLTVRDDRDGTNTTTVGPIAVNAPVGNEDPTAALTVAPLSGTAPAAIGFDGRASFDADGDIVLYRWDWDGDGSFDESTTTPTPIHTYTDGGIFLPAVNVVDNAGASNTVLSPFPVVIAGGNAAPVADFTAVPDTGTSPLTVGFDATASTDDGSIVAYEWEFGDGSSGGGTLPMRTYQYRSAGSFTATLTVRDDAGASASTTRTVTVDPQAPGVAGYLETLTHRRTGATTGGAGGDQTRASFVVSHDPSVAVTGVRVDLDGNGADDSATAAVQPITPESVAGGFNFSKVTLSRQIVDPGTWVCNILGGSVRSQVLPLRAKFVLSDGSETPSQTLNPRVNEDRDCLGVSDHASMYAQTQTASRVQPGGSATFTFRADDPDCEFADAYRWRTRNLDTGATSAVSATIDIPGTSDNTTTNALAVTFPNRGRYVVEAEIASRGTTFLVCTIAQTYQFPGEWFALGSVDVNTTAPPSPTVSLSAPASVTRGDAITVTATPADIDGQIQFIEWDLDGTPGYEVRQYGASASAPNLMFTQVVQTAGRPAGALPISVRVTDNGSLNGADDTRGSATASASVTIENAEPGASAIANPTSGKAPLTVAFDASGSADPDGTIASYDWDFDGDATVDETTGGPTTSHEYTTPGTYSPTVTVTDADGATASAATSDIVVGEPNVGPTAVADVDPTTGQAPLAITAEGGDSDDADGTIVSHRWNWGDGTADEFGPSKAHTYHQPGTYTVTLTVKDDDGATATDSVEVTVDNAPPIAEVTVSPLTGVALATSITFDASGSSDPNGDVIVSYEWDFDNDGTYDRTTGSATTSFVYLEPGTFTAAVRVTDNRGGTGTAVADDEVVIELPPNIDPSASFTVNPSTGGKPLPVAVDASASSDSDPFGGIDTYTWNWGDSSPVTVTTTPSASHTYPGTLPSGMYTVVLTVTDNRGGTASTSRAVTILAPQPNTKPVSRVSGSLSFPGAVSGTAVAAADINALTILDITLFYFGSASYRDPASNKQATCLVITDRINRYGLNGADFTAFCFTPDFQAGPVRFRIDDRSSYGEGNDTVSITAGYPLSYTNTQTSTGGNAVVLPL